MSSIVINMVEAMGIVSRRKNIKNKKREMLVSKLQQWKLVYDNLGREYVFYPEYIAVKKTS